MIALRPRIFVNRGSILASGFLIPWDIVGLPEARRRVLDLWQPGVQVKQLQSAFLVLLQDQLRVVAGQAVGEPLLRVGPLLVALPITENEVASFEIAPDSLVFAAAGKIHTMGLPELPDEDIARWIDTSTATIVDVISLGAPPVVPVFQVAHFDSRRDIPGVPPASFELEKMLAEIRGQQISRVPSQPRESVFASATAFFRRLANWIPGVSFRGAEKPASSAGARLQPARESSGLWRWFSSMTSRMLRYTRLSKFMSARMARYLSRMMEMMDSGDLLEGLRYAIPLEDANKLVQRSRLSFRMPQPRTSLSIKPSAHAAQSVWGLQTNLYHHLRNLYRQAFQRLEAQGRIEEAAFVLTELLAAHAEAVSFLEKHGRLRLAAEIAEAHRLSPAMAIRLWWLANERRRAVTLACRTGEFETAIRQLSGSHPAEACKLRIIWAGRLAASGKYLSATDAIWPVKEEHHLAYRWFGDAIESGGIAGAIALARKASRWPETFDELLPKIQAFLDDESYEFATHRLAFADALRHESSTATSPVLARMAVRALIRDLQRGFIEIPPAQFRHLLDYTGDSALRADVPTISRLSTEPLFFPPSPIEIAAHDAGRRSIYDIVLLPDGRMLLALGESGLLLLSREGKTITQWNQPAHHLVASDDGNRVLGIAPRDSVCRLIRIDLNTGTASYWCDATITAFASNFDGALWCVANGQDVFIIDTLARQFDVLWRIPDLGGNVRALRRNVAENRLLVVSETRERLTLWTYQQPSWVLRFRMDIESPAADPPAVANPKLAARQPVLLGRAEVIVTEAGTICEQAMIGVPMGAKDLDVKSELRHYHADTKKSLLFAADVVAGSLRHCATRGTSLAVPVIKDEMIEVFLLPKHSDEARLRFRLHRSQSIALRFSGDILLCADDQGRVLAVNVVNNHVVRNLRV